MTLQNSHLNQILFGIELREDDVLVVTGSGDADMQSSVYAFVCIFRQYFFQSFSDQLVDIESGVKWAQCPVSCLDRNFQDFTRTLSCGTTTK